MFDKKAKFYEIYYKTCTFCVFAVETYKNVFISFKICKNTTDKNTTICPRQELTRGRYSQNK